MQFRLFKIKPGSTELRGKGLELKFSRLLLSLGSLILLRSLILDPDIGFVTFLWLSPLVIFMLYTDPFCTVEYIVVSTVLCGILFARFHIVDYINDQGEKKGGGKQKLS